MNITPCMIYWMTRMDCIRFASITIAIIFFLLAIGAFFGCIDKDDKAFGRCLVGDLVFCSLAFAFSAVFVFLPSTRDMAAIYVVPKIANSQTVKDLGEGVVTLTREWIEELCPAKKGGAK